MAFFNQFPNRTYDLKRDGNLVNIQDLFRNVDVNEQLIDKVSAYQFYKIKDGERPDQASFRLYQNAGYYWTFFIVNDDLKNGYKNWPKSYQQLQDFVKQEYTDYAILELKPDDFSKVAAISNYTSLSLGFQYDSPLGPYLKHPKSVTVSGVTAANVFNGTYTYDTSNDLYLKTDTVLDYAFLYAHGQWVFGWLGETLRWRTLGPGRAGVLLPKLPTSVSKETGFWATDTNPDWSTYYSDNVDSQSTFVTGARHAHHLR